MKRIGITGPSGSGKSTLFRAIAGPKPAGDVVAVSVPDERLDKLAELHSSRKTVYAQIQVVDVTATARTAASAAARLRNMDALLAVVPSFGGQDGTAELEELKQDLVLTDMGPFETRLSKARKDPASRKEVPALEKALDLLNDGRFLSSVSWETDELWTFSALAPVTLKPMILVDNVDEDDLGGPGIEDPDFTSICVSAPLEAEVAGLGPDEARDLLSAYGVSQPVMGLVIQQIYRSLDLITFFTTGDDESRAWEVRRGATAPEAAGAVHSDIQRGFIRAEVISYDVLIQTLGDWDQAKAEGRLRVEGKDYVFQEGDVAHFRFNV